MVRKALGAVLLAGSCFVSLSSVAGSSFVKENVDIERRLSQKVIESVQAPWLRKVEHEGVVYFLYASPALLRRFDSNQKAWLSDISLDAVPKALAVSDDGIFVSQNINVRRFALNGSGGATFPTAWANADDVGIYQGHLLSSRDRKIQSVRIDDGVQVDVYESFGGYDTPRRFAVSRTAGYLFGWQVGLSPSDILRVAINTDGSFGSPIASPYHGDFPAGTVVFPSVDASIVVDQAGIAFDGGDLTYLSGTGGPLRDVVIDLDMRGGGGIFVLRDARVAWLDGAYREVAVKELVSPADGLSKRGDDLFLYRGAAGTWGIDVQRIGLKEFFSGARPPAAPNPVSSPYVPDFVDMSDSGVIYLFSKAQRAIHRFSVVDWAYSRSAALGMEPVFAAVNRADDQVYVAYEGGRLALVNPDRPSPEFLAFGPVTQSGLGAADDLLMTVDDTGAWNSHRIYNQLGQETDWVDWNRFSLEFSWNRAVRRMFFFRQGTSPNNLHYEELSGDGVVVSSGETPYNGSVQAQYPIRPAPNGSRVYLGSGQMFDAINMTLIGQFPVAFKDLAWVGGDVVSMHAESGGTTRLVKWRDDVQLAQTILTGSPVRVFGFKGEAVAVTVHNGVTFFHRW